MFRLEVEWDTAKAAANIGKHGVSFVLAATVLRDPLSDEAHSESEERWITIGRAASGECLVVVHTWTDIDTNTAKARIISAREADNSERREYEEEL